MKLMYKIIFCCFLFSIQRLVSASIWIMVMRLCTGYCPGQFTCGENECIPYSLVCNGNIDCQNEHSIAYEEYYVCLIEGCNEKFKCDDGTCIPFEKLCDSHSDCAGGEDETRCYISGLVCPGGSKCKNGMCIPSDWMCDGTPHCHDESDESPTTCNPEEFTTQMMEASTNSSTEDQPKRETKEQSRYQTTSPMHQSNDTNGGESGIEKSSASVSGGGVLMGNNGDVLRSSMNNGLYLRMNAMTIFVGLSLVRILISSSLVIVF